MVSLSFVCFCLWLLLLLLHSKANLFVLLLNAYFSNMRTLTFTVTMSLSHFKLLVLPPHTQALLTCPPLSRRRPLTAGFFVDPDPTGPSGPLCPLRVSSAPSLPTEPLGPPVSFRWVSRAALLLTFSRVSSVLTSAACASSLLASGNRRVWFVLLFQPIS